MAAITVLSAADIEKVFTIADALEAVEDAYRQKAEGAGVAWPMVYAAFEPGVADMDIRSGELSASGLFGLKLTAWFSNNPAQGLPEIYGTTLICDNATGAPLALLNASAITGLRTGAAGALGIKWLARKDAQNLLVAGSGHQSAYQVAAVLAACPGITHVEVWNPRKAEAPEARVALMRDEVAKMLAAAGIELDYEIVAVADGEAACGRADAIITITPATTPIIKRSWVRPGTHISCAGADMEGKQEIESELAAAARLYVDDCAQSVTSGELEVAVKDGAISADDIVAELGEVIAGKAEGRTSDDQITVFDTSGIAVQDLASSKVAYERAVEAGLGVTVEL
ncbi:MAG: ornithine cyclodeaminase family protein [Atopobiaceae bacterium]|nr:ornithine cyclodeaminase family protein [Atopobiaceae bacterium]